MVLVILLFDLLALDQLVRNEEGGVLASLLLQLLLKLDPGTFRRLELEQLVAVEADGQRRVSQVLASSPDEDNGATGEQTNAFNFNFDDLTIASIRGQHVDNCLCDDGNLYVL